MAITLVMGLHQLTPASLGYFSSLNLTLKNLFPSSESKSQFAAGAEKASPEFTTVAFNPNNTEELRVIFVGTLENGTQNKLRSSGDQAAEILTKAVDYAMTLSY